MTLTERRRLWAKSGATITESRYGIFYATDIYGKRWVVTSGGAKPHFDNPKAADLYRDYQTLINTALTSDDVRFAMSVRDQACEAERQVRREAAE